MRIRGKCKVNNEKLRKTLKRDTNFLQQMKHMKQRVRIFNSSYPHLDSGTAHMVSRRLSANKCLTEGIAL